jgi:hypothetical protein
MNKLLIGMLVFSGLLFGQEFGTKTTKTPTPKPGVIDCQTYSGKWTVAFRDATKDLKWLRGGILVQPVDSPEVRMSKQFVPYTQIIKCDVSVVEER